MTEEDTIKINTASIKNGFDKTLSFFKQKKVLNIIIILLFLVLLVGSSWVRLQNLPLLKDSTTGEYIPLALDPFYFLRVAETIVSGGLPEVDVMKNPTLMVGFTHEILPRAVVFLQKIISIFDKDVTLRYIDVISPVIFFVLGLIVFFLLIWSLTGSKVTALISSGFLAVLPTYLHRTLAGFSDHEAIGMFAFFLVMLIYALALKFLEKDNKKSYLKVVGIGLLVAFFSAFTVASWGGIARFLFMIVPLSFGLIWLIKSQKLEEGTNKKLLNYLIFYVVWLIFTILFTMIYGFNLVSMISSILFTPSSLLMGIVFLFLIVDYLFILKKDLILKEKLKKYRVLLSLITTIIIGSIFFIILGKDLFAIFPEILGRLLQPFGADRIGLTVAENAQPFLEGWIAQMSKTFFWLFFVGIFFVGVNLARGMNKKRDKFLFSLIWIAMFAGILFSRISSGSLLNGTNFISKLVYFSGLLLFIVYSIWLYFKEEIKIENTLILIASWLFIMLIAARGAVRLFFVITPFVCFMVGYSVFNLFIYARKNKGEIIKMFLWLGLIISVVLLVFSFNSFSGIVTQQAKFTGPSAGPQWQEAMSWVRENTNPDEIFVHWWDYGFWVQYLGERITITDGGHGSSFWDHLIGRYVLTTPEPESALSFMKAHSVSYLLIDPTDLGKYPAYSKIGSGPEGKDRFSSIPIMQINPGQTTETSNSTIRVYLGGSFVDQDIIYNDGEREIFLPANGAGVGGVILEMEQRQNQVNFNQPRGIFVYNGQQYDIPLRYIHYRGQIFDFKNGIEATVKIIPKITQGGQGIQIDNFGSLIYLSPKTMNSLFAQLYLLDDAFDNYETISLSHSEPDPILASLNSQGANVGDIAYFQGFRAPIKIWKIDYPSNLIAREEFLRESGEFAEFDGLTFTT